MDNKYRLIRLKTGEVILKTDDLKTLKRRAKIFVKKMNEEVLMENLEKGTETVYPASIKEMGDMRFPGWIKNEEGDLCYAWGTGNEQRKDGALYNRRTNCLIIGDKVIDKHPVFNSLTSFKNFVVRYLEECRDGYNPQADLEQIKTIEQVADYINVNFKSWKNVIVPFLIEKGWTAQKEMPEIIGQCGNKLLYVSNKGLARILNDNCRMEIAQQITDRIGQLGLTPQILAERSGVPYQNVYSLLNGRYNASLDILNKIVDVLEMKIQLVEK